MEDKIITTTASEVVRGIGILTTFWKKVESAIREVGGNDEHLARLAKDESNSAIKQFAAMIVHGAALTINSFRAQIQAGNYDHTYGLAEHPEDIKGQQFHPVTSETVLDHPDKRLTTAQVYERYAQKMADLSELLDYGIKHPDDQREFPIVIVWKDEEGQFWCAILGSYGSRRRLHVNQVHPVGEWDDSYRFLLRK